MIVMPTSHIPEKVTTGPSQRGTPSNNCVKTSEKSSAAADSTSYTAEVSHSMSNGNVGTFAMMSGTDTVMSTAPRFMKAKRIRMMSAMARTSATRELIIAFAMPLKSAIMSGILMPWTPVSPVKGMASTMQSLFFAAGFDGSYRDFEALTMPWIMNLTWVTISATMYAQMIHNMEPPTKNPPSTTTSRLNSVRWIFSPLPRETSLLEIVCTSFGPRSQRCTGPQMAFQMR
mmetsp:Transcript_95389/g.291709  ORF Transcript_95389/g.291709 Transcript_95389/m.291709 type:complete len:230 (-) Transcript_95389:872-1561(-)